MAANAPRFYFILFALKIAQRRRRLFVRIAPAFDTVSNPDTSTSLTGRRLAKEYAVLTRLLVGLSFAFMFMYSPTPRAGRLIGFSLPTPRCHANVKPCSSQASHCRADESLRWSRANPTHNHLSLLYQDSDNRTCAR
ncbi:hypothetical protein FA95DRAFT_1567879, partial [Auriscalpium vulgare]